jgi:uncharacterized alpha/beta hydrolase family protein
MKRYFVVLIICVVVAIVLGSCQGGKKCPAYSQYNTEKTTHLRS